MYISGDNNPTLTPVNVKVNANIESSFNTQPIEEADLITEKKLDIQLNERKNLAVSI